MMIFIQYNDEYSVLNIAVMKKGHPGVLKNSNTI